jgi:type II secretory pathway component GspD/PulD (secretin)
MPTLNLKASPDGNGPARPTPIPPIVRQVSNHSDETGVASNEVFNTDPRRLQTNAANSQLRPVAQSAYEEPLAAAPTKVVQPPSAARIRSLSHLTWEMFEQRLMDTWGSKLKVSTSSDGRFARVLVPQKQGSDFLPMLIDRASNELTFEGIAQQQACWNQLVAAIDQAKTASHVCQLIDAQSAEPATIQQAAFSMGFRQDQPQGNTVVEEVQVPNNANREGQPPVVLTQESVQGAVKIQVVPELGIIILEGEARDVAIVRKMIDEIIAKSVESQPVTKNIPLVNQQSNTIAEQIQTLWNDTFAEAKGPATIIPLNQSNSLFVIGQQDSVTLIEQIVKTIDVESVGPVAPDFKVFKLKYMSAIDAKNRIEDYFGNSQQNPRTETEPPSLPSVVILDYRSNTLIVKATEPLLAQVQLLLDEIDVVDIVTTDVVRVIPLKNSLATQLAPLIQNVLNGNLVNASQGYNSDPSQQQGLGGQQAQNTPQDLNSSNARSAMLEIMSANGQKIQSAILFDVRVSADANSNSLVVTGPEKSMGLIEELVRRLDKIPDAETQIKVFPILNGDAEQILAALQSLFQGTAQGQQGQQGIQGQQGQTGNLQLPLQTTSAGDGQSLANLRFSFDSRSNTIIASGPAGDLMVVEDLIDVLDAANPDGRRTTVYRLSNLSAQDMATAINDWLDRREQFLTEDPTTTSEIIRVRRLVSVTPVDVGNSLIVSAVPEYYNEIAQIIHELDRRPPMIKVKAMLVQINLNKLEEFGIEFGVQDSLLFDRGTADNINFNFNQSAIGNSNVGRSTVAGQALSNLSIGRTNSALGYGGLVLSAGSESISALIRALENKGCVRVLSKPHLMTIENLQGRIQVGQSIPRITGSTQNVVGGVSNQVESVDVGVILEVTPRVSPDGTIVMFVNATRSRLGSEADGVVVAVSTNGDPVRQAPIDQIVAQTTIQARSGQTVVISGLIEEEKRNDKRGMPILSDLPVVGPLFSYEREEASRSELLIILTPYIVEGGRDIKMQNQDDMDRMHWCLCDVAEVYGNTDYEGSDAIMTAPETYYPDMDPSGLQPQMQDSFYPDQPVIDQGAMPARPGFEGNGQN